MDLDQKIRNALLLRIFDSSQRIHYSTLVDINSTVCVTCGWAGGDNTTLTESAWIHTNCLKTRRIPPVGCTKKERGSFFTPETVQQMEKVYSQVTDLQAEQSSGGMPKRHPRGAPWLPVTLIYALVARGVREDPDEEANIHKRPGSVNHR